MHIHVARVIMSARMTVNLSVIYTHSVCPGQEDRTLHTPELAPCIYRRPIGTGMHITANESQQWPPPAERR
jgi:hypothetical protein